MAWRAKREIAIVNASSGLIPTLNHIKQKTKMPLVNVHVIENVFTPAQKKEIITKLTDAMVAIEGEAFRSVTWVKIEEVKEGDWGIGGRPLHLADVQRMKQKAGS